MAISTENSAILLVGPGVRGGGAEGQFALMARHFFAGRLPVALLTGKPDDVAGDDSRRFHFLDWRNRWSYLRIIPAFWWLVFRGRYRVLFAFGLFPCLLAACATLARRNKPLVIVSEITRPQKEDEIMGGLRRVLYRSLRRFAYRRAYLLTANSIDGLQEMCAIAGLKPEKGQRVMNIIEHESLRRRAAEPSEFARPAAHYFVCASRLDPMKRLDTVIAALALLPADTEIHLLLIGDGPARAALAAQTARLGLAGRVHFTGWMKNPAPLVKNAAALILASEYEGFSNSVLEAMFLDVPVITSRCGADAEEMCEQGAALGFPVGDAEQLAAQMSRLLAEPGLVEKLIGNARRYRRPHTLEESLPQYEKLLLAALAGRASDEQ